MGGTREQGRRRAFIACGACTAVFIACSVVTAVVLARQGAHRKPLPVFPPDQPYPPGVRAETPPADTGAAPIVLALSGGGERARTFATAFSRAAHASGLLSAPALQLVSANSGGSWFLSQFAYDLSFYDDLLSHRHLEDILNDMWERFNENLPESALGHEADWDIELPGFAEQARAEPPRGPPGSDPTPLEYIQRVLRLRNWRSFIRRQVLGERVSALPLERAYRHGGAMPQAELLFQTANASTFYLYGPTGPLSGFVVNQTGQLTPSATSPLPFSPLAWAVPGTNSSDPDGDGSAAHWVVPTPADQLCSAVALAASNSTGDRTLLGWLKAFVLGSSVLPIWRLGSFPIAQRVEAAPFFGNRPKVADVVAASSAAAGVISGPLSLYELLVGIAPGLFGKEQVRQAVDETLAPFYELGVCTRPSSGLRDDDRLCRLPHVRLVDGAYIDNTAVAVAVGRMQRKAPDAPRLRFVIAHNGIEANPCAGTPCGPGTGRDDLSRLFASGRARGAPMDHNLKPGDEMRSCLMQGVGCFCPQVFAADFAKEVEPTLRRVPGTSRATYTSLTTTTVANKAFGVAAGTTVDILIACMDAPLGTVVIVLPVVQLEDGRKYAAAAADGESEGMAAVIRDWLGQTAALS
jgi:hypothetical protein